MCTHLKYYLFTFIKQPSFNSVMLLVPPPPWNTTEPTLTAAGSTSSIPHPNPSQLVVNLPKRMRAA
jgi:hypothetical protein